MAWSAETFAREMYKIACRELSNADVCPDEVLGCARPRGNTDCGKNMKCWDCWEIHLGSRAARNESRGPSKY